MTVRKITFFLFSLFFLIEPHATSRPLVFCSFGDNVEIRRFSVVRRPGGRALVVASQSGAHNADSPSLFLLPQVLAAVSAVFQQGRLTTMAAALLAVVMRAPNNLNWSGGWGSGHGEALPRSSESHSSDNGVHGDPSTDHFLPSFSFATDALPAFAMAPAAPPAEGIKGLRFGDS